MGRGAGWDWSLLHVCALSVVGDGQSGGLAQIRSRPHGFWSRQCDWTNLARGHCRQNYEEKVGSGGLAFSRVSQLTRVCGAEEKNVIGAKPHPLHSFFHDRVKQISVKDIIARRTAQITRVAEWLLRDGTGRTGRQYANEGADTEFRGQIMCVCIQG